MTIEQLQADLANARDAMWSEHTHTPEGEMIIQFGYVLDAILNGYYKGCDATHDLALTPGRIMKTPKEIVDAIINDIMDRRGLSDEWDMIEHNIRDEIRARWIELAS